MGLLRAMRRYNFIVTLLVILSCAMRTEALSSCAAWTPAYIIVIDTVLDANAGAVLGTATSDTASRTILNTYMASHVYASHQPETTELMQTTGCKIMVQRVWVKLGNTDIPAGFLSNVVTPAKKNGVSRHDAGRCLMAFLSLHTLGHIASSY